MFIRLHLHWSINSGPQAQLEFGLSRSVQLFVDGRVAAIEGDVGSGRIREAIKSDFLLGRDGKQEAKLDAQESAFIMTDLAEARPVWPRTVVADRQTSTYLLW